MRPARIAQTHTYRLCLDMEAHSSETSARTFRVTANPRILHIRRLVGHPALQSPPTVIIADHVVTGIDVEHLHGARCRSICLAFSWMSCMRLFSARASGKSSCKHFLNFLMDIGIEWRRGASRNLSTRALFRSRRGVAPECPPWLAPAVTIVERILCRALDVVPCHRRVSPHLLCQFLGNSQSYECLADDDDWESMASSDCRASVNVFPLFRCAGSTVHAMGQTARSSTLRRVRLDLGGYHDPAALA